MRAALVLVSLLGACSPMPVDPPAGDGDTTAASSTPPQCRVAAAAPTCSAPPATLTGEPRRRAEALTSLFENRTVELQYDYIEALGDGRGYTAGRAGFTTGTGDLLVVAERYTTVVPDNPLAPLLPRLRQLAQSGSGSTSGLSALPKAWRTAAADPAQRDVQDQVVDEMYFQPAMAAGGCVGAALPLSLAFLYDTNIQHGDDDDPDSMGSILERTRGTVGGTPADGVDELVWLRALMAERRRDLARACDASTRHEWAESVDRVDAFVALLDAGEVGLDGPLSIELDGDHYAIP